MYTFSNDQCYHFWIKLRSEEKLPGHSSDASDDSGAAAASADPEAMMLQSLLKIERKEGTVY